MPEDGAIRRLAAFTDTPKKWAPTPLGGLTRVVLKRQADILILVAV